MLMTRLSFTEFACINLVHSYVISRVKLHYHLSGTYKNLENTRVCMHECQVKTELDCMCACVCVYVSMC